MIQVLNPFPLDQPEGALVAALTSFILLVALIALWHEAALWVRSARLDRAIEKFTLENRPFRRRTELDELVKAVSAAAPTLAPAARKLLESSIERENLLWSDERAAGLFTVEALRAPDGISPIPEPVRTVTPGMLTAFGILGTFIGLVKGLGEYDQSLANAAFEDGIRILIGGLSISFRVSVWGLITSIIVTFAGRWSAGRAEVVIGRLEGLLDTRLARAGREALLAKLVAAVEAQALVLARVGEIIEKAGVQVERADASLLRMEDSLTQVEAAQDRSAKASVEAARSAEAANRALGASFQSSLTNHLVPALDQLSKLAEKNRAFVEQSTEAHLEAVEKLTSRVVAQVDLTLGQRMKAAGDTLSTVARTQADVAGAFSESARSLEGLAGRLEKAADSMQRSSETVAGAVAPLAVSSTQLSVAAERLNVFVVEAQTVGEGWKTAGTALSTAAGALDQSAQGYGQAAVRVGSLVEVLERTQEGAAKRLEATMDKALGESLRLVSEAMDRSADAQGRQAAALEKAAAGLGGAMAAAADSTHKVDAAVRGLSAALAPAIDAAGALGGAATQLQTLLPALERSTTRHAELDTALAASATALGGLAAQYGSAAERFTQATGAQTAQIDAWKGILGGLDGAARQLRSTTGELDRAVAGLTEAMKPAAVAGDSLRSAAEAMGDVLPRLESWRDLQSGLVRSAQGMDQVADRYQQAAQRLDQLLGGINSALERQHAGSAALAGVLDQAKDWSASVPSTTRDLTEAALQLSATTQGSASIVGNVKEAMVAQEEAVKKLRDTTWVLVETLQDQQVHWDKRAQEMDRLQTVVEGGVTAVTQRLPQAIDRTLVDFDAALGEGVDRLGSSVERLREALDDLHERLEEVLGHRKGR